jgi:ribosomal protein S18 acetylase RimI-like enzyme
MTATDVTLRPAAPADRDLFAAVYASAREDELAGTGWSEAERAGFLAQQFHAQTVHYESHYPGATLDVVLVGGEPAGRLFVHRREASIHVMEIGLLPEFRGRGVGSRLLRAVLDEAAARGVKATINVEPANPARRLYERLGFRVVAEAGFYLAMEAEPSAEQGLVAGSGRAGAERDEEDVERSEPIVGEPVDALGEQGRRRPAEAQPERRGQLAVGSGAEARRLGELELGPRDGEALADQGREGLEGQAFRHPAIVATPGGVR